jgi:hypothetical protein
VPAIAFINADVQLNLVSVAQPAGRARRPAARWRHFWPGCGGALMAAGSIDGWPPDGTVPVAVTAALEDRPT